jgi:cytochrome c553
VGVAGGKNRVSAERDESADPHPSPPPFRGREPETAEATSMLIRVYVDDSVKPVAELAGNSGRVKLDTTLIPDGAHRLRFETVEGDRVTGRREIPFTVRNGPGIAVAGLSPRDEVRGNVALAVDATDAGIDADLDVHSLELHRGLPFWTGILSVAIIALGALYLAIDPLAFRAWKTQELAVNGDNASFARRLPDQPSAADPMQVSLADGAFLPVLPFDPGKADTARGATTYAAKCAGCHGAQGEGRTAQSATLGEQGVFPRLAGQPAAYLYRQLWSFAHSWRKSAAMPPLADGLAEADWTDIAVHLEQLATSYPPPTSVAADVIDLGRSIATAGRPERGVSPCWRCHGPTGIGVPPFFPALIGQYPRYIAAQLIAFRDGQRRNAMLRLMDPVAHGLEPKEIEAVAGYYAGLRPGALQ